MRSQTLCQRFFLVGAAKGVNLSDVAVRFGQKLRAIRQQKGISQEQLAAESGLHRTYVSSVERGERNISIVNIEKLAAALGIRMSDLMP